METTKVPPRPCRDVEFEEAGHRLRKPPKLVRNKNGARVRINGRDFYCGVWGSAAATKRYRELIAEWMQHGCRLPPLLRRATPRAPRSTR